ncbi:MAG: SLC13 family permease, partial [Anaerolineae bacterium]
MVDPDTSPLITPARLIAAASVLTGLILIIAQPAAGATTAGLTVFVITFWAVNVIPAYLSALIFMLLAVVLNAAPPEVVFAGFTSAAFWLVFGGLIIGAAIEHTGLAERIAQGIAGRLRASYPLLIAGLVVLGIVLAFLMPSSVGRVVLLTPILMALTESLGFQRGSSGHTGILLAGICGTVLPSYGILTGIVRYVVLAGAGVSVGGFLVGCWV